jgi:hypothetical protein
MELNVRNEINDFNLMLMTVLSKKIASLLYLCPRWATRSQHEAHLVPAYGRTTSPTPKSKRNSPSHASHAFGRVFVVAMPSQSSVLPIVLAVRQSDVTWA